MADELDDFFTDIAAVEAAPPQEDEALPSLKRARSEPEVISAPPKKAALEEVVIAAKPMPASIAPTTSTGDDTKGKFSFASSSSSVVTKAAVAAPAPPPGPPPAPPPGPPPAKPMTEQYKGAHMGMTEREAQSLASQQSAYDYDKQQQLAAMGVKKDGKKKLHVRVDANGNSWVDKSLDEWPEDDWRLFVGDLGNEVTEDLLARPFSKYASFNKVKVVRDKFTGKSKGFGFVSFQDPFDCAKCLREMQGKYVGNRPMKLSKSNWQDREITEVRKKEKKDKKAKKAMGLV